MSIFRRLAHGIRARRERRALLEELEHHRALIQEHLEREGVTPEDAAAQSRRQMGNATLAVEDARAAWVRPSLDRLWRDVRYGARGLRREWTFTCTAVFPIALGLMGATTLFAIADSELWRPLPFPNADRLVAVSARGADQRATGISGADLVDWRARSQVFADLAIEGSTSRRVLQRETADSIIATTVSDNFFRTLGIGALQGRPLQTGDGRGDRVAVLTDRGLARLFDGRADVVGRRIRLDGEDVAIVGVVPGTGALGGPVPDAYVVLDERAPDFHARTIAYSVIGRLRDGVAVEAAQTALEPLVADAVTTSGPRERRRIQIDGLRDAFTGHNWRPLFFFLGAALVLLGLSAINTATLLLSRAIGRSREFALRGALGGGVGALVRQLLVESGLVALPSGVLGVLLATWAVRGVAAALPADFLARGADIPMDLRVWAFAAVASTLVAVILALAPLPLLRRVNVAHTLQGGTRVGQTAGEHRLRGLLLVVQVAVAVVLLSGGAIFAKSFVALRQAPLGFDPADVAVLRLSLTGPRYQTDASQRMFAAQLLEAAGAVPGVATAAIATSSPLGSGPPTFYARSDRPRPAPGDESRAILRAVTPDFFRTLRIPVIGGRTFVPEDDAGERVAVVNATLARAMFPGEDAVGRSIDMLPGSRAPWTQRPGSLRIIGVVSNVKNVGMNEVEFGDVYVPFASMPASGIELLARTRLPAATLLEPLRASVSTVDRSMPVTSAITLDTRVETALRGDRFNTLLVSSFAIAAVLLASLGVYGAAAYQVRTRTRELGIRLALGAPLAGLLRAAAWRTARLAAIGVSAGLVATIALSIWMGDSLYLVRGSHEGLLYGVTTTDPAMLGTAVAIALVLTLAASLVPASYVFRLDPLRALRAD